MLQDVYAWVRRHPQAADGVLAALLLAGSADQLRISPVSAALAATAVSAALAATAVSAALAATAVSAALAATAVSALIERGHRGRAVHLPEGGGEARREHLRQARPAPV